MVRAGLPQAPPFRKYRARSNTHRDEGGHDRRPLGLLHASRTTLKDDSALPPVHPRHISSNVCSPGRGSFPSVIRRTTGRPSPRVGRLGEMPRSWRCRALRCRAASASRRRGAHRCRDHRQPNVGSCRRRSGVSADRSGACAARRRNRSGFSGQSGSYEGHCQGRRNGSRDRSSPSNVRVAVEGSLKRLATDCIDLDCQHGSIRRRRIEDTVGTLAELVAEGKVRYIGLSEAGSATIPPRPRGASDRRATD